MAPLLWLCEKMPRFLDVSRAAWGSFTKPWELHSAAAFLWPSPHSKLAPLLVSPTLRATVCFLLQTLGQPLAVQSVRLCTCWVEATASKLLPCRVTLDLICSQENYSSYCFHLSLWSQVEPLVSSFYGNTTVNKSIGILWTPLGIEVEDMASALGD